MRADLLADIGLARLRLPIPMVKLRLVHSVADALADDRAANEMWGAYIRWLSELDLESEVLEALCVLCVARNVSELDKGAVQRAVARPSILSDFMLERAFGTPTVFKSWLKCYSGEAVGPLKAETHALLQAGHIIPPILRHRMERLAERSDLPFMDQWAFEFERVAAREALSDGYSEFFADGHVQEVTGQFIRRSGHIARSAYLRTLAFAVDQWDMPESIALAEAQYCSPCDPALLGAVPGRAPSWAQRFQEATPRNESEWGELVRELEKTIGPTEVLVHLNMPCGIDEGRESEIEVISILGRVGKGISTEEIFDLHDRMPGRVFCDRSTEGDIELATLSADQATSVGGEMLLPALVPIVNRTPGYLQSDLIRRMPYLPTTYDSKRYAMRAVVGGGAISDGAAEIGRFYFWPWRWTPTHNRLVGSRVGVAVTVKRAIVDQLYGPSKLPLTRLWKAKNISREKGYGEWTEIVAYGEVSPLGAKAV